MCELLKVSRSGYYKWLKNKDILNNYVYDKTSLDSTQIGNGILLINDYLNEDAECVWSEV